MSAVMVSLDKKDLYFILDMIAYRREEAGRAEDYSDKELMQINAHLDALERKARDAMQG